MNLPLPTPAIHAPFLKEVRTVYQGDYYTAEQVQAYVQQCREAALEEAAQICNGEQWLNSVKPVDYIKAFNEGCQDCEAAIRRLK